MAVVNMDLSELKLMEKNAELLEESNKEILKLSEENKRLQQQNIDTLKANEKNVTIVIRTSLTTTHSQEVSDDDINRHLVNKMSHVLTRIVHELMDSPEPFKRGGAGYHYHNDMTRQMGGMSYVNILGDLLRNKEGLFDSVMRELHFDTEGLRRLFFSKPKTSTKHFDDEITTQGLDEVKVKLKEEAFKDLSLKAQKALDINPQLSKQRDDAVDDMKAADRYAKKINKRLELAESLHLKKDEEIKEFKAELSKSQFFRRSENAKLNEISLVVSPEITTFGNKKKLVKVKQIIERKDER